LRKTSQEYKRKGLYGIQAVGAVSGFPQERNLKLLVRSGIITLNQSMWIGHLLNIWRNASEWLPLRFRRARSGLLGNDTFRHWTLVREATQAILTESVLPWRAILVRK